METTSSVSVRYLASIRGTRGLRAVCETWVLPLGKGSAGSRFVNYQSGRIEARTGLRMMPTSPRSPIIPYGGFSPVRLEGWRFGRRLPNASLSSSLLPAYADHVLVCFRPSCIPSYPRMSRSVSGRLRADAPPWRVGNPPPPGSSLESGLCCPGLSSLNRPHPPHSQAHHDFAARRLMRNAFAVRERLGDPRVVPGFR
jgi:hypothetical protein